VIRPFSPIFTPMQDMENLLEGFEEPQYQYVGFWPRLGALFIDGIILVVVNWLLGLPLAALEGQLIPMIVMVAIPLLYNVLFEYRFGATPGKMLLKIKIVNYQLQPPTISNVLLRNIIYICMQFLSLGRDLWNYFNNASSTDLIYDDVSDLFALGLTIATLFMILPIAVYLVELVFLLTDPKFRALHDRIGKTYVVKDSR
jgi:uncharacterized RDD family membrane protein YckC